MKEMLTKYARLIVKKGINVGQGQDLVINSPVECAEFARIVAEQGYLAGAKEVTILWNDEKMNKITLTHADEEVLSTVAQHLVDTRMYHLNKKAGFISIAASDPSLLLGVDTKKISVLRKARNEAFKPFNDKLMANSNSWCVVSIPTVDWAKKVFPEKPENEVVGALWDAIFKTVRCDSADPVKEWEDHVTSLKRKIKFLNEKQFVSLRYKNSIGTDVTVGLPKNHIWSGASEENQDGVEFIANMPTEEVFTAPDKDRIDGTIVSSKPLCFSGNVIEGIHLTYKDGKLLTATADKGQEILDLLINEDEHAGMLGEVALVPHDSPISNMNLLFFNTLFDENASCHFAFGMAYPNCIEGGTKLSEDELRANGLNVSLVHEDFMVGTADLSIVATDKDGQETVIFKDGNFAI